MEVSRHMDAWLVRLYRLVLAKRGCWEAIWNIDIRDAAAVLRLRARPTPTHPGVSRDCLRSFRVGFFELAALYHSCRSLGRVLWSIFLSIPKQYHVLVF
jgi:hypothetical protein